MAEDGEERDEQSSERQPGRQNALVHEPVRGADDEPDSNEYADQRVRVQTPSGRDVRQLRRDR